MIAMPIFEFRCLKCNECFEILVMQQDEMVEMQCPKCSSENFERIMSCTSYAMGDGSDSGQGVKTQTKTCSSGSCTTYEIPGPTR
jgi:putative FmdB family regulatory protein